MKQFLRTLIAVASSFVFISSNAQITKLANNSGFIFAVNMGKKAVLVRGDSTLWTTDGTAAGTVTLGVNVKVDIGGSFAILNGKIYFAGIDSKGSEFWVTNGTAAGTKLVKDVYQGSKSGSPKDFYVFNNAIYFFATTKAEGDEFWKSDGTAAGTALLADINKGKGDSYDTIINYTIFGSSLLFTANDGSTKHGDELWKTDGTTAGTILVKDINSGINSGRPESLTLFGTSVFFSADDGINGRELWKTNGTSAGTVLVKDILSTIPNFGSSPTGFYPFNGKLYFDALDLTSGIELYSTDGTTAGTGIVKDIYSGFNSSIPNLALAETIGNKFYFTAADASNGNELWSSNGTAAGTTILKDINPGAGNSNGIMLVNFLSSHAHSSLYNGKFFMEANNGTNGTELWASDGTAAGTALVKDINPTGSSFGSTSFQYAYTTGGLYFSANDGTKGIELFLSDGTSGGTNIVKDINPGSASSNPAFLTMVKNHILFTADDGDNGLGIKDLYKINATVDTLPHAAEMIAVKENIAPNGTSFSIFPNPVKTTLTLKVTNLSSKRSTVIINDANGKQVYNQNLNTTIGDAQYQINTSTLKAGIYYLQLVTEKGNSTLKFIKE